LHAIFISSMRASCLAHLSLSLRHLLSLGQKLSSEQFVLKRPQFMLSFKLIIIKLNVQFSMTSSSTLPSATVYAN